MYELLQAKCYMFRSMVANSFSIIINYYIHIFQIQIEFTAFAVEYSTSCIYDYVTVFDGLSTVSSSTLGKFCGANLPPITKSSGNDLLVTFITDSTIQSTGFQLTWAPRGDL